MLWRDEIEEQYFEDMPFYMIIRDHNDDENWTKLKDMLGAILVPFSLEYWRIIVGVRAQGRAF